MFNTGQFEVIPVPPNYVTIFADGAGVYTQPLADGTLTGPDLIAPLLPVNVYGQGPQEPQLLLYAGTAPGLAAGVLQVNFQLKTYASGVDQYRLVVGDYDSQPFNIYTVR